MMENFEQVLRQQEPVIEMGELNPQRYDNDKWSYSEMLQGKFMCFGKVLDPINDEEYEVIDFNTVSYKGKTQEEAFKRMWDEYNK